MTTLFKRMAFLAALACCLTSAAESSFLKEGEFLTGCNYWASNAGMYMWHRWDSAAVAKDIADLAANGVNVMRVFPLWSDFQPLTQVVGGQGRKLGLLQNDEPLQNEAGVDEVMVERFRFLCAEAEKHHVKLVVGLVTGWMSGRLFVPPAFNDRNVLTDPEVNVWQVRYVRHLVNALKDCPAIVAWDLGNECNCMAQANEPEAWRWMNMIASAIRLADPTRPVVSGMHSPITKRDEAFCLQDQGELTDILTTHPYPLFTPTCAKDPFDSLRSEMHPTAESLLYADISGRPCFVEEAGDLGRSTASPERAAANLKTAALSAWAHGIGAYVWWCAYDQGQLDFPPYNENAVERELGLFTSDRQVKPALKALAEVRAFIDGLPGEWKKLSPRQMDAVCLVSSREAHPSPWLNSFGAFLLAKQAGFDLQFADAEKPLPEAKLYIVPSGQGTDPYTMKAWKNVLAKVEAGATLFVSKGNGTRYTDTEGVTGNRIERFMARSTGGTLVLDGHDIAWNESTTTDITPVRSQVLASDKSGRPLLTKAAYGKGTVVFCNFALESMSVNRLDCFNGAQVNPAYLIYRKAAEIAGVKRAVWGDVPSVVFTEHPGAEGVVRVIAINTADTDATVHLLSEKHLSSVLKGEVENNVLKIKAHDIALFEVKK